MPRALSSLAGNVIFSHASLRAALPAGGSLYETCLQSSFVSPSLSLLSARRSLRQAVFVYNKLLSLALGAFSPSRVLCYHISDIFHSLPKESRN
jgi:hypothetical protein